MSVAQAKVSRSAAEARSNGFLKESDRIVMNRDNLIGEAKKEVLKMVDDGYAPPLKKKIPVGAGTLATHTPLFIAWLIGVVIIVGALGFLPALALGPIVEHLMIFH